MVALPIVLTSLYLLVPRSPVTVTQQVSCLLLVSAPGEGGMAETGRVRSQVLCAEFVSLSSFPVVVYSAFLFVQMFSLVYS